MKKTFLRQMLFIALPISIQALFQASLSVVDQFMVGQLGETSISAIAFGGKYMGIVSFTINALAATASILIAQAIGKDDNEACKKSFSLNYFSCFFLGIIFFILGFGATTSIMRFYTPDESVINLGETYLKIVSIGIFPLLTASMLNVYLQNNGKSYITMIVGVFSTLLNAFLNWLLIFGIGPFEALGVGGAALATLITYISGCFILLFFSIKVSKKSRYKMSIEIKGLTKRFIKTNFIVAIPLVVTEFLWSVGESVYATIYGHMSTEAMAAMANISPVISLSIGFFSGLAAAAGIMTGQKLGEKDEENAYKYAKNIIYIELVGSIVMGLIIVLLAKPYANIYNVSEASKIMTVNILYVYAIVLWTKVSNMVAGRIIQSGGKTVFNFIINIIGTWVFGIPLGLIAANVFHLEIQWVYLLISLEELVRAMLCFGLIKSKKWIKFIDTNDNKIEKAPL